MRAKFADLKEFDGWHQQVCDWLGLPLVGVDVHGTARPDCQATTAYCTPEVAEDGTVEAEVGDVDRLARCHPQTDRRRTVSVRTVGQMRTAATARLSGLVEAPAKPVDVEPVEGPVEGEVAVKGKR